jgi:hypothetical protein
MSNIVEQAAAGAPLVVFMAGLVAVAIGFVAFCDRLKDRLSGIRRIPKAQRNLVNAWRLHMIAKGRATWKTAPLLVPSQQELDAMMAEIAEEAQEPASKIAIETDSLVQVSPEPEAERPEILFENGKAIIRPHTRMLVPVSTMRLTFQDGEELDVSSDMEFAGLNEEDFRAAYAAFTRTQAELRGIEISPPLNSKFWKDRGEKPR